MSDQEKDNAVELVAIESAEAADVEIERQELLPEEIESADADFITEEAAGPVPELSGTELSDYEAAEIEDLEFIEEERLDSILESVLFATDRPISLNTFKMMFKGTNVKGDRLRRGLDRLAIELAGAKRGVSLEEVPGGYQLRTKLDNLSFLTRSVKTKQFRLSGPALEVLSIVAYKQPLVKNEIDQIRGVESGHLLRALMEKNLVTFGEKSNLPGKPMQYETTRKFLEIFSLRNLQELPSLSQIDELLPEGITEDEVAKPTLSQLTDSLSESTVQTYSQGEEELMKIAGELETISSSSDFFEQEKLKQKQKREAERAQDIREAILVGETVSNRDRNWLARFDEAQMLGQKFVEAETETPPTPVEVAEEDAVAVDPDDQLFSEEGLEANDLADIDGPPEGNPAVEL